MDEGTDLWYEALKLGVQFSGTTKCATLEIFRSGSRAEPYWIESSVDDVTLARWLDTVPTIPCADGQGTEALVTGLRLVIAVAGWIDENATIPISLTKESFSNLQKRLHLPEYFLSLVTSFHTRGFEFPAAAQDLVSKNDGFLLKIPYYREDFIQIAITHDAETNVSTGLAVIRSGLDIVQAINRGIEAFGNPGTDPLLLPLIFLDKEVRMLVDRMRMHHKKLDDLENSAGQHEYNNVPLGNPLELDFVSTTRRLNFIGCGLSFDLVRIKCILLAFEQITHWRLSLASSRSYDHDSKDQSINNDSCVIFTSRVEYLENTCRVLILEAESEQSRVHALSQAVYQFMAAKDARTNLSLAETSTIIAEASKEDSAVMRTIALDTQRDSSAMKTISILGMVFLPGTFIAAIFAMPVFNWDGDGAPVIKSGFKYYWAVTIPLTILVLTAWALGMALPWKKWLAKSLGLLQTHHSAIDNELTGHE